MAQLARDTYSKLTEFRKNFPDITYITGMYPSENEFHDISGNRGIFDVVSSEDDFVRQILFQRTNWKIREDQSHLLPEWIDKVKQRWAQEMEILKRVAKHYEDFQYHEYENFLNFVHDLYVTAQQALQKQGLDVQTHNITAERIGEFVATEKEVKENERRLKIEKELYNSEVQGILVEMTSKINKMKPQEYAAWIPDMTPHDVATWEVMEQRTPIPRWAFWFYDSKGKLREGREDPQTWYTSQKNLISSGNSPSQNISSNSSSKSSSSQSTSSSSSSSSKASHRNALDKTPGSNSSTRRTISNNSSSMDTSESPEPIGMDPSNSTGTIDTTWQGCDRTNPDHRLAAWTAQVSVLGERPMRGTYGVQPHGARKYWTHIATQKMTCKGFDTFSSACPPRPLFRLPDTKCGVATYEAFAYCMVTDRRDWVFTLLRHCRERFAVTVERCIVPRFPAVP